MRSAGQESHVFGAGGRLGCRESGLVGLMVGKSELERRVGFCSCLFRCSDALPHLKYEAMSPDGGMMRLVRHGARRHRMAGVSREVGVHLISKVELRSGRYEPPHPEGRRRGLGRFDGGVTPAMKPLPVWPAWDCWRWSE
ncbi:hypothetical protein VTK56DRAFT_8114 [Thermocarpiscus australiensis]